MSINDRLLAYNNNEYTIAIFQDLSKAFDTIDHKLLFKQENSMTFILSTAYMSNIQRLHLLSLDQLYDYCLGKFMNSHIYKTTHVLFLEEIMHNRDVHQYHINSRNVHIKYYRTVNVKNIFSLLIKVLCAGHYCQRILLLCILSHHFIGCIKIIFSLIVDLYKFKLFLYGLIVSLISLIVSHML